MVRVLNAEWRRSRRLIASGLAAAALAFVAGCTNTADMFSSQPQQPAQPPQQPTTVGTGQVRVGLILPLSGQGNAASVALSMKNAAEMALAEFSSPNIQLLVKDDGGTAGGAQIAASQALEEGAEIIVGPLFAHSVGVVGQASRARGVPVIYVETANARSRVDVVNPAPLRRLVALAHAAGIRVVPWYLPGFRKPRVDRRRLAAAIAIGGPEAVDGVAVDIEATYVRNAALRSRRAGELLAWLRTTYPKLAIGAITPRLFLRQIVRRAGFRRVLVWATVAVSANFLIFAVLWPGVPIPVLIALLLLSGMGRTTLMLSLNTLGYAEVPPERMSRATTIVSMSQQLFNSLGVSVGATLLSLTLALRGASDLGAADFWPTYVVLAALPLLSLFYFVPLPSDVGDELSGHRGG